MAVDSNAALAAEQDAVARLFENLQRETARAPEVDAVTKAVVELLNVAVPYGTCVMCGQDVEDHARGCAISQLQQWLKPAAI